MPPPSRSERTGLRWSHMSSRHSGSNQMSCAALCASICRPPWFPSTSLHFFLPRNEHGKVDRRTLTLGLHTQISGLPSRPDQESESSASVESVRQRVRGRVGHDKFSIDDDFFDLGGDSLLAMTLVARLEQLLDREVRVGQLTEARSVRRLSRLLDAQSGADIGAYVVPLRTKGTRPPLFLLPPGGGSPLQYEPLTRFLPANFPVFGLQAPGADGRSEPLATIDELGELFTREILRVQARGPYRLLGWSTGGLTAYEVARRLRLLDHEVSFVGMIDTVFPGKQSSLVDHGRFLKLLARGQWRALSTEAAGALERRLALARRIARRRLRRSTPLPPDLINDWTDRVAFQRRRVILRRTHRLQSRAISRGQYGPFAHHRAVVGCAERVGHVCRPSRFRTPDRTPSSPRIASLHSRIISSRSSDHPPNGNP